MKTVIVSPLSDREAGYTLITLGRDICPHASLTQNQGFLANVWGPCPSISNFCLGYTLHEHRP